RRCDGVRAVDVGIHHAGETRRTWRMCDRSSFGDRRVTKVATPLGPMTCDAALRRRDIDGPVTPIRVEGRVEAYSARSWRRIDVLLQPAVLFVLEMMHVSGGVDEICQETG